MAKMRDLDLEGRVILLATDNSPGAVAGARIAMALATKHRALVHVLNVIDTRTTPFPPAPSPLAIEHAQSHQAQANEVRASLCSLLDTFVDWPVRIALGTPAAARRAIGGCGCHHRRTSPARTHRPGAEQ